MIVGHSLRRPLNALISISIIIAMTKVLIFTSIIIALAKVLSPEGELCRVQWWSEWEGAGRTRQITKSSKTYEEKSLSVICSSRGGNICLLFLNVVQSPSNQILISFCFSRLCTFEGIQFPIWQCQVHKRGTTSKNLTSVENGVPLREITSFAVH